MIRNFINTIHSKYTIFLPILRRSESTLSCILESNLNYSHNETKTFALVDDVPSSNWSNHFKGITCFREAVNIADNLRKDIGTCELIETCGIFVEEYIDLLLKYNWAVDKNNGIIRLAFQGKINKRTQNLWRLLKHSCIFPLIIQKHEDLTLSQASLLLYQLLFLNTNNNTDVINCLLTVCSNKLSSCVKLEEIADLSKASLLLGSNGIPLSCLLVNQLKAIFGDINLDKNNIQHLLEIISYLRPVISQPLANTYLDCIMHAIIEKNLNMDPQHLLLLFYLQKLFKVNFRHIIQTSKHINKYCNDLNFYSLGNFTNLLQSTLLLNDETSDAIKKSFLKNVDSSDFSNDNLIGAVSVLSYVQVDEKIKKEFKNMVFNKLRKNPHVSLLYSLAQKPFIGNDPMLNREFSYAVFGNRYSVYSNINILTSIIIHFGKFSYKNCDFHNNFFVYLNKEVKDIYKIKSRFMAAHCIYYFTNVNRVPLPIDIEKILLNFLTAFTYSQILTIRSLFQNYLQQHASEVNQALFNKINTHVTKLLEEDFSNQKKLKSFLSFYHKNKLVNSLELSKFVKHMEANSTLLEGPMLYVALELIAKNKLYAPITVQHIASAFEKQETNIPLQYLLEVCSSLNIEPQNIDYLAEKAVELFDSLSSKEKLETAKSLVLLQSCPNELLKKIFNPMFLASLNSNEDGSHNEIETLLMEVNRCAVIDHPELYIPWLFKNVAVGNSEIENKDWKLFQPKLADCLEDSLGSNVIEANANSYNHNIDFKYITRNNYIYPKKDISSYKDCQNTKRHAVLLQLPHHFCSNEPHLTGSEMTRIRHLKMLGYEVTKVPFYKLQTPDYEENA